MKETLNSKKKIFVKSNIPNILTIVRIALSPIVIILLLCSKYDNLPLIYSFKIGDMIFAHNVLFFVAGILFVIASITDFFDGYLARKYHWISDFGKLWDPIADKVLINGVLISLGYLQIIPIWISIIMITRDIIVDATRMVAASQKIIIAANIYGKLKTITQMFAIIVIFFLFNNDYSSSTIWFYWSIQNILMLLALLFSVLSGVIYEVRYINLKKKGTTQDGKSK